MTPPSGEPALVIEGLVSGYGGGDVLHDVSLTVPEGGVTCVVGPNGAGQSTLLGTISGLLRPRRGSITFRGESLVGKSPRQILDLGLVHVPQAHSLFRDMTVRENIELGGYTVRDRSVLVGRLADIQQAFPQVAAWAGKKAGSLPAGDNRRARVARRRLSGP